MTNWPPLKLKVRGGAVTAVSRSTAGSGRRSISDRTLRSGCSVAPTRPLTGPSDTSCRSGRMKYQALFVPTSHFSFRPHRFEIVLPVVLLQTVLLLELIGLRIGQLRNGLERQRIVVGVRRLPSGTASSTSSAPPPSSGARSTPMGRRGVRQRQREGARLALRGAICAGDHLDRERADDRLRRGCNVSWLALHARRDRRHHAIDGLDRGTER